MASSGETTVGVDAVFTGLMTGEDLSVLGQFEGELEIRGTLRVGPQGRVKANVQAAAVEVRGEFAGDIRAGALLFGETARATGRFWAEKVTVRDGAVVNGAMNMDAPRKAAAPAPQPAVPQPPASPADAGAPGGPPDSETSPRA